MVCHSLLQWITFCQTFPPWPGWPHMAWRSFIELDMLWSMWSDWLVFWDYDFSVSAFWCPLATPTILLGFLLSWTWGISSQLLQQSAATAPYLGQGVTLHGRPSWPWPWSSSSWPSCTHTATTPWMWGCSSAGQEGRVRTGYEITDWFQIGKGVCQVCILSLCLFDLYSEYIMWNPGLEEAQAGIKIARRNISNLR